MSLITLINYGRWYYEHASTYLPVMTDEAGRRSYFDQHLRAGHTVLIRNATPAEHAAMAARFDLEVDDLAINGFVSGIGNFDKNSPPPGVKDTLELLKIKARYEPMQETP